MSDNESSDKPQEIQRLISNSSLQVPLEEWGPYLSARQWGTVREDYSPYGHAWQYFPHDHARSRAYRWGEDGIGGISDIKQHLCFAPTFWNGHDTILKERLFGLTNPEGNHGEDVKELYYYLDNVPTHFYMKYLYKYPQAAFPYQQLIEENYKRGKEMPEFELLDTGVFKEDRYFDIYIEYAKKNSWDTFIKIQAVNRGPETAPLTILPTLWFFNYWQKNPQREKPIIQWDSENSVKAIEEWLGIYYLYFSEKPDVLFTENETNFQRLFGRANRTSYTKDVFNEALVNGTDYQRYIDKKEGTKCAPVYHADIPSGQSYTIYLRLVDNKQKEPFIENFESIFEKRKHEADEFYNYIQKKNLNEDQKNIQRQAFAGMLWNKQYYHYDVEDWLNSDDGITPNSEERKNGRNSGWKYLRNNDILSMPDNWEYPWYAAWDLAFHCITLAHIDPVFAKHQISLMLREWYMNPQGQIPAYEWNFSDVNPPVHAFAALHVYKVEKEIFGTSDIQFLKEVFQKLIINFTWWTNQKDPEGNNIFEGGFLGLDNIGLFNRSMTMPSGTVLQQADGTSWMGMYALDLMDMAITIAQDDPSFENSATKFYEHFAIIAQALNVMGLWDEDDKFYYDFLFIKGEQPLPLKVRSFVGLTPIFAASIITKEVKEKLIDFSKRVDWFHNHVLEKQLYEAIETDKEDKSLVSLVNKKKLEILLQEIFDEAEFLSPYGIRSLSKFYDKNPYSLNLGGQTYSIQYTPGESDSQMFGGNSNWRGPIWMPLNYLLIESLNTFASFFGDSLQIEFPVGSGNKVTLHKACDNIRKRLLSLFEKDAKDNRPIFGEYNWFYSKDENKDLLLYHEYFHGESGKGLGASHQTGWTGLIANLIQDLE